MKLRTPNPSLRSIGAQAVPYSCSSVLRASNTEDSPRRELVPRLLPASFRLAHHSEKKLISGSKYCGKKKWCDLFFEVCMLNVKKWANMIASVGHDVNLGVRWNTIYLVYQCPSYLCGRQPTLRGPRFHLPFSLLDLGLKEIVKTLPT